MKKYTVTIEVSAENAGDAIRSVENGIGRDRVRWLGFVDPDKPRTEARVRRDAGYYLGDSYLIETRTEGQEEWTETESFRTGVDAALRADRDILERIRELQDELTPEMVHIIG